MTENRMHYQTFSQKEWHVRSRGVALTQRQTVADMKNLKGPENAANKWLNWCSANEVPESLWKFIWIERAQETDWKILFLIVAFMHFHSISVNFVNHISISHKSFVFSIYY